MRTAGIPILLYHGVTSATSTTLAPYSVSPEVFAKQMAYLAAKRYTTMPLSQVVSHIIAGAPLPQKPIAITFDDGFLDTYLNAFPILLRYGFTATVFIVAERVGRNAEWDSSCDEPSPLLMSWEQIREMVGEGISVGAHSCTHPYLAQLNVDEARGEIERSRKIIEDNVGVAAMFFAYPHSSFNDTIREIVRESGYSAAFSTRWGLADSTNDVFSLNRMMVLKEHDFGYFKWMVDLGVAHPWYYRILKGKKTAVRKMLKSPLLMR